MKLLKAALPHVLAVSFGAILVMVFFSPLFFENKILDQNDIFQGIGAGQEVKEFRQETGEEALWTNSMFSGMPAYLINISYSGEWIKYVHNILSMGMPSAAQVIFLSYLCFYVLLIVFGVHPLLAVAGAVAYSFNTFNLVSVEAGHIWKVRAIAYMPLVIAGVYMVFEHKRKWLAVGVLGLAVALELYANHLQITYYLFLMLLVYGVIQLLDTIRHKTWSRFGANVGALLLAALLGIGANTARLWTTLEYSPYSTRGKSELTASTTGSSQNNGLDRDYVFNWSYGVLESFTLLIPDFSGGASVMPLDVDSNLAKALASRGADRAQIREQISRVATYWGDQPIVAGPSYVGAIILFCVILAWFYADKAVRNWLLIAAGMGLVLSWGKNFETFNYLMYDFFPGYNKFRSVSMAMVILLLALPLLGTIGLDRFLKSDEPDKQKKLWIAGGMIIGICLLIALFAGVFFDFRGAVDSRLSQMPDWYISAIRMDRKSMLMSDAFRSALFVGLTVMVIWAYTQKKTSMMVSGAMIVLLVLVDFMTVGKRFFDESKFIRSTREHAIQPTDSDQLIMDLAGDTHYRVLNLQNPFNEAYTSAFHSSIGGYHGAKMKRYQELISYAIEPEITAMISGLRSGDMGFEDYYVINMLNTRYIKYGPAKEHVIPNPSAFGNGWLANNIRMADQADEELDLLRQLSDRTEVVINRQKFEAVRDQYPGTGTISLTDYTPNHLTYEVKTDQNGLAVFSEIYYPKGWTATVDGEAVPILQANYVLRAIEVPAGRHTVEFRFEPASYRIGNLITMIFSVLLFAILGIGIYRSKDELA